MWLEASIRWFVCQSVKYKLQGMLLTINLLYYWCTLSLYGLIIISLNVNSVDDLEMTEKLLWDDWKMTGRSLRDHFKMIGEDWRLTVIFITELLFWLWEIGSWLKDDWDMTGRWLRDFWKITCRIFWDDWETTVRWMVSSKFFQDLRLLNCL